MGEPQLDFQATKHNLKPVSSETRLGITAKDLLKRIGSSEKDKPPTLQQRLETALEVEGRISKQKDLTDEDLQLLTLCSELMGVAIVNTKGIKGKKDNDRTTENARLQSIDFQQEVLKLVLANFNQKTGLVNPNVGKYFLHLGEIFSKDFDINFLSDNPEVKEVRDIIQAIQGMITTAILFKSQGWEIAYPKPEDDLRLNTDLFVRNPITSQVYSLDITASAKEPYFVAEGSKPWKLDWDDWTKIKYLRVNVPPMIAYDSDKLYVDRALGLPNAEMTEKFKYMLTTSTESKF